MSTNNRKINFFSVVMQDINEHRNSRPWMFWEKNIQKIHR